MLITDEHGNVFGDFVDNRAGRRAFARAQTKQRKHQRLPRINMVTTERTRWIGMLCMIAALLVSMSGGRSATSTNTLEVGQPMGLGSSLTTWLGTYFPSPWVGGHLPASTGSVTSVSTVTGFQTAINGAVSGTIIELAAGTYDFNPTSYLSIINKTWSPANPVTIRPANGAAVIISNSGTTAVKRGFYIERTTGLRILGKNGSGTMLFDGQALGGQAQNGIKLGGGNADIEIADVDITRCRVALLQDCIKPLSSERHAYWNCRSYNNSDHGYYLGSEGDNANSTGTVSPYSISGMLVVNCLSYDNYALTAGAGQGYGFQIGDSVMHARIIHCTSDNNGANSGREGGFVYFSQTSVPTGMDRGTDVCFYNNIGTNNEIYGIDYAGPVLPNKATNIVSYFLAFGNGTGDMLNPNNGWTAVAPNYHGDPGYQNRTAKNFRLSSTSYAVGLGDPAWSPSVDYDGLTRPATPSVGAFDVATTPQGTGLPPRLPFSTGLDGTYYVDPSNTTGAASDAMTTTQAKVRSTPWLTINHAFAAVPITSGGAIIVVIGNGISIQSTSLNGAAKWTRNGLTTDPVTLKAETPYGVTFTGTGTGGAQVRGILVGNGGASSRAQGLRIQDFVFSVTGTNSSGLDFNPAQYCEILRCKFTGGGGPGYTGKGFVGANSNNLWCYACLFHDNSLDTTLGPFGAHNAYVGQYGALETQKEGWEQCVIANCIFYGSVPGAHLQCGSQFRNGFIVNNTFYNNQGSGNVNSGTALLFYMNDPTNGSQGNIVKNNIMLNNIGKAARASGSANLIEFTADYNDGFGNVGQDDPGPDFDPVYGAYTTGAIGPHGNLAVDPKLRNPAALDFRPQQISLGDALNSPMIGAADPAYMPTDDYAGNPRTAATATIGAYEGVTVAPTTPGVEQWGVITI